MFNSFKSSIVNKVFKVKSSDKDFSKSRLDKSILTYLHNKTTSTISTTTMQLFSASDDDAINISESRIETLQGVDYLVVPTVILMSKVVYAGGTNYGAFIPANVLEASVDLWDSTPVIVDHPSSDSTDKLGNSIDTQAELGLGVLSNTSFINNKLYSELWINQSLVSAKENEDVQNIYSKLCNNEPCELSVGVKNTMIAKEDVYNNLSYQYVWRDIKPLHLAVLTSEQGACSIKDGCGTLPTELKSVEDTVNINIPISFVTALEKCKCNTNLNTDDTFIINLFSAEMYAIDRVNLLYTALDKKFGYVWLYTYNDTDVLYENYDSETDSYVFYSASYTYNEATNIVELGEPKLIRITIAVVELITARKSELMKNLAQLHSADKEVPDNIASNEPKKEIDMNLDNMNLLQAIEEIKKEYPFIANEMSTHLSISTQISKTLINKLSSNTACRYTIDQLNSMSYDTLVATLSSLQAQSEIATEKVKSALASVPTASNVPVPEPQQVPNQFHLASGANPEPQQQNPNQAIVKVASY